MKKTIVSVPPVSRTSHRTIVAVQRPSGASAPTPLVSSDATPREVALC
jgi:hypothetical protein